MATINLQAQTPRDRLESCVNVMTELLAEFLPDIHSGVFPALLARVREQLLAEVQDKVAQDAVTAQADKLRAAATPHVDAIRAFSEGVKKP